MLSLFIPTGSVSAASIVSPSVYAWSDTSGYVSFAQVTVDDTVLRGYAWSANDGWIHMDPAQGGVFNDGFGNLSGFAWGERLGWIDFDQVSIGRNGRLTGTATGVLVGTLTFDCPEYCDVTTDWRPLNVPGIFSASFGSVSFPVVPPALSDTPATPALSPPSATERNKDIIKDGVFDVLDFNAMMVHWGITQFGDIADMNGDGVVQVLDFNELMVSWGRTYLL